MIRNLTLSLVCLLLMINTSSSISQNNAINRSTIPNVVSTNIANSPYFAIQILALKEPSKNTAFFKSFESAREFKCTDGYYRYVVGAYSTQQEAQNNLSRIRGINSQYAKAYVVNTANYPLTGKTSPNLENTIQSNKADKFSQLRTSKKIIVVDKASEPYFAIQLLAMKTQPQDPNFFENVEYAREFNCKDGFTRWVIGQYNTKDDAYADLAKTRSLNPKYKSAFVVNTSNYQLSSSDFTSTTTAERTTKRITPTDNISNTGYSIQVLALKESPKDASFFDKLDAAKEVSCIDGYKRYLVGDYTSKEDASIDLAKIRSLGSKYKNAFIVDLNNIKVEKSAFTSNYESTTSSINSSNQTNSDIPKLTPTPNPQNNLPPKDNIEQSVNKTSSKTQDANNQLKTNKSPIENSNTTKVPGRAYDELSIETSNIQNNSTKSNISTDNSSNRTNKKIIPVDNVSTPYYTVQLLAIKETPKDPNFFDNIDKAKEFSCTDGYKRYVVGEYKTRDEAVAKLKEIRNSSPKYKNAFIANTGNYQIEKNAFKSNYTTKNSSTNTSSSINNNSSSNYDNNVSTTTKTIKSNPTETTGNTRVLSTDATLVQTESIVVNTPASAQRTNTNKVEAEAVTENTKASSSTAVPEMVIDPNKIYVVQITASRYPFYISDLKEFKEVYEFYMPDKVYRYTTGKYRGATVKEELKKVISYGYKEAFIVEWDKYAAYQIE